MKAFIVHAHPEPASFNGALLTAAVDTLTAAGHEVQVSDLHRMGWNPVSDRRNFTTMADPAFFKPQAEESFASENNGFAPDIAAELEKLAWCDTLILQFPLWWFGLPAILKGWVDRVFVMGQVYGGGKIYETGTQRGKRALLSLTTGGPEAAYRPEGFNGDIDGILRPIQRGILEFVGFSVLRPNIVWGPARASAEDRAATLTAYATRLRSLETESPIVVGRY